MYQIIFTSGARKDLKKIPEGAQDYLENICLPQLMNNPYQYGTTLHGIFKEYWKYTFTYKGVHYRIVYQVSRTGLFIFLIKIGTRENFYKELKRRVR
jgi:mRNA-degrading endonuclease RelE of RelBE toxin-antitoxin system